MDRPQKI